VGTLAVIGVGLIGGSYGLAAKAKDLFDRVVGCARSEATARAALECGAVDRMTNDPADACRDAEMVVLCTPPESMAGIGRLIADTCPPSAIVTDAASVKGPVVAALEPLFGDPSRFVGGHPMAGSERSGVANADAGLFRGATYVVTPTERTSSEAAEAVRALVGALDARLIEMSPARHDAAVALASHVPHIAAAALARRALARDDARAVHGTGLWDTTRVAAGDPALWCEILLTNADAIAGPLGALAEDVSNVRDLLRSGDREAIEAWLAEGARLRRALPPRKGSDA